MERTLAIIQRPLRLALSPLQHITVSGLETFPRTGPVLLLANHAGFLDPATLILATRRPIQFMATESLLQESAIAPLLCYFGVVSKKKLVTDTKAVRQLKAWADLGAAIGLFPEGTRTWDGERLPLAPGVEKLVRLLGIPVVTARLVNAYHQWPRWAEVSRFGRVHVELDPPRVFERGTPAADLRAAIDAAITPNQAQAKDWRLWGRNLARGVSNPLFSCPSCGTIEALREKGNRVHCHRCGAAWNIDLQCILHPEGGGPPLSLVDAIRTAHSSFAETYTGDPARFDADGTILLSEGMQLLDTTGIDSTVAAEGQLRLHPEGIEVVGSAGKPLWSLPLTDLDVADVDMRRRLVIRSGDQTWEAVIPKESVIKWGMAMAHWQEKRQAPTP
jgi:1-acyl-sn-glycerol-3-phosphate acyltransferase